MVALLCMSVVTMVSGIAFYRRLDARLNTISQDLWRLETAIGAQEWVERVESHAGTSIEGLDEDGVIRGLHRIEIAVDPMARAKDDARRAMNALDIALREDDSNGYEHWQVSKVLDLVERSSKVCTFIPSASSSAHETVVAKIARRSRRARRCRLRSAYHRRTRSLGD